MHVGYQWWSRCSPHWYPASGALAIVLILCSLYCMSPTTYAPYLMGHHKVVCLKHLPSRGNNGLVYPCKQSKACKPFMMIIPLSLIKPQKGNDSILPHLEAISKNMMFTGATTTAVHANGAHATATTVHATDPTTGHQFRVTTAMAGTTLPPPQQQQQQQMQFPQQAMPMPFAKYSFPQQAPHGQAAAARAEAAAARAGYPMPQAAAAGAGYPMPMPQATTATATKGYQPMYRQPQQGVPYARTAAAASSRASYV